MGLASELLKFFYVEIGSKPEIGSGKNLLNFVDYSESQEERFSDDLSEIIRCIQFFKNKGFMSSFASGDGKRYSSLEEKLITFNYNEKWAKYGSYDFMFNGFLSIAEHFKEAVRPVIVKTKDNIDDIGTGFLLGNNKSFLTARHVVEKMQLITIPDLDGNPLKADVIILSKDPSIDIALIRFSEDLLSEVPSIRAQQGNILDEVLTIGYPPIPGFDAFQLYEVATVNTSFKLSKGRIVGKTKSYLDSNDYFLINAKVKGGNSGSPVINESGHLVGMVIQIPFDPDDVTQLDKLGYGIVTPTSEILKFLDGVRDDQIVLYRAVNVEGGFRIGEITDFQQ